ncbi:hypothetical protein YC2023_067552 [Brassica napus]
MAASQIVLSELRPGCCARIVVTRLLRFWEARNAKKGGALMGVDMLLLDDQELSGFDVTRSSNHFKLCDSVVGCCICFCGGPEEARLAMERM